MIHRTRWIWSVTVRWLSGCGVSRNLTTLLRATGSGPRQSLMQKIQSTLSIQWPRCQWQIASGPQLYLHCFCVAQARNFLAHPSRTAPPHEQKPHQEPFFPKQSLGSRREFWEKAAHILPHTEMDSQTQGSLGSCPASHSAVLLWW